MSHYRRCPARTYKLDGPACMCKPNSNYVVGMTVQAPDLDEPKKMVPVVIHEVNPTTLFVQHADGSWAFVMPGEVTP